MKAFIAALVFVAGSAAAQVQTQVGVPPTLEVQRIAPQLVAFAGGEVNFANLVNGLALGLPVTLTTPIGTGVTQVVTFTPTGTMSALQVAQTLETARQALITRGIAAPTAQQIGVTLVGGVLPTAVGGAQVTALVQSSSVLGASTVTQQSVAASLQSGQTLGGTTVRNTSDTPFPRGISDTPQTLVPGVTGAATTSTTPVGTLNTSATPPRVNSPFINGVSPATGGTVAPFAAPR